MKMIGLNDDLPDLLPSFSKFPVCVSSELSSVMEKKRKFQLKKTVALSVLLMFHHAEN